jgi:ParB-like chromosome segregation protein Spo0J
MIDIPKVEKEIIYNLKEDKTNPNKMTEKQLASVANSIKKYGFIVPIIVNKDNVIIDGHQRFLAGKKLGLDEVPVVKLDVDKVDAKLLKQIMNKLKGTHDFDLDLEEYKAILEAQGDLDYLKEYVAMEDEEIQEILNSLNPPKQYTEEELDDVPEADGIETDIKYGDVFGLGAYIMVNGKKEYIEIIEE